MGQVSVTLNNRTYRLACNDGEEQRLAVLAGDVKARVESLAREFGHAADERILLMAAVLLADELMDLREAHEAMLAAAAEVLREAAQAAEPAPAPASATQVKAEPAKADAKAGPKPDAGHHTKADPKPDAKAEQRPAASSSGSPGSGHPAMPPVAPGRTKAATG